ncbi:radical SAM family heme chaperone HemW [Clostridium cylindrosporum]|uniref:Heme chaperone HemW n=1 Tax=Clostridium cylindrosporum DSM 605 TaxID=1121307 RepID=A0A0J8DBG5_CLOCY|nr:radical SAM family heme chaperone HemW [Clostridium cylindrosporum]KMT21638.1 oxygen-independent coproporphyrinogen-III oxidase-like protein YqeR [Clostridium cylindrosporum DSM 605]
MKSLYIHIPFCARKCLYCDFNSYENRELEDEYIKALLEEISTVSEYKFKTIFIGGGTPTILSIQNLELLLKSLEKFSPVEFSVECNPGTLTKDNLSIMKKYGVNRLSIGLQSTNDKILKSLGRIHNFNEFLDGYNMAREVGFDNINIDLMFAVPNQRFEDFKESLEIVTNLNPEHISAYSLIVEEGTPFYAMQEKGKLEVVDEDVEREMYDYLIDYLQSKGYKWYEISNFAKDKFECSHNKCYWKCEEYIGVGAGAHSYIDNKRFSNAYSVNNYIKYINLEESPIESEEIIDESSAIEEFMFLGLRLIDGISKLEFEKRFKKPIYSIYSDQINSLKDKGLIIEDGDKIMLSRKGVNLSNSVFVEFIN